MQQPQPLGYNLLEGKIDPRRVSFPPLHRHDPVGGSHGHPHPTARIHCAPKRFRVTILGVDIGGTNMRAGVVQLNLKAAPDLSKIKVWKFSLWRHGDEEDVKREHAVESLVEMLKGLIWD